MNNILTPGDFAYIRNCYNTQTEGIVHAPTAEIADNTFEFFKALGYQWSGDSTLDETNWHTHQEDMCYFLEKDHRISYANMSFFREDPDYMGITIHTLGQKD